VTGTAAPRFYLSLRSPYSWLAYHDLVERHRDLVDLIDWRPFWEPDARSEELLAAARGRFVYTPMSREKHLYVLQDVSRLAAQRGLSVCWPLDRDPCWEVPHLAYLAARRHGRGRAFAEAAQRARWQEGRDICAPETVGAIARELGLDPAEAMAAADDPELRAAGTRCLLDVYRDGVFGVPFFVCGRDKYWGVDRLDAFAAAVRSATVAVGTPEEPRTYPEPAMVPARTTDWGHAGGCG
jgi:2-hydroxychromene-2-carboxylate isomerase